MQHLTPWAQAHYKVEEEVVVKNGTAIKANTIALGATTTVNTKNGQELKTIPCLHIIQSVWPQTKAEVELKELTFLYQL